MRIAVIGHFGGKEIFADGQTIKTKSFYYGIKKYLHNMHIDKVDTYYYKKNKFRLIFSLLLCIFLDKKIVILPCTNGKKVLFPLMYCMKMLLKKDIYHSCIGGAVIEEIKKYPRWKKYLNSFDKNWMESEAQARELIQLGVTNAKYLPNFKDIIPLEKEEIKVDFCKPYKFCIFSRVIPEKGIEEAAQVIKKINEKYGHETAQLDIYGPVPSEYQTWFNTLLEKHVESSRYCGVIEAKKSVEILKGYFVLLFPTQFYTEGMPGTIIDAMCSGVPVIARRWAYCDQMIKTGYNGISYDFDKPELLFDSICQAIDNPEKFIEMRCNCIEEGNKYIEKTVISEIIKDMDLIRR